jgi:hypothetical protein
MCARSFAAGDLPRVSEPELARAGDYFHPQIQAGLPIRYKIQVVKFQAFSMGESSDEAAANTGSLHR